MQKLIKLEDGQEILLDGNLAWTMEYQNQFGHDILPDLMPALSAVIDLIAAVYGGTADINDTRAFIASLGGGNATSALVELAGLRVTDLFHIIWAMAKCADDDIAPPRVWLKQFEYFPLDEIIPEALELIIESSISRKNSPRLREKLDSARAVVERKEKA